MESYADGPQTCPLNNHSHCIETCMWRAVYGCKMVDSDPKMVAIVDNGAKEKKILHGSRVTLTPTEYNELIKKFGKELADAMITDLDLWKGSTGKVYKSDYYTLLSWDRKNAKKQGGNVQQGYLNMKPNAVDEEWI